MASGLTNLSPITVGGEDLPTPQLFHNIPMLHRILEEVVEDWLRVVEPYQRQVDDADDDSARIFAAGTGFMELRPHFLKCLFSYIFFFVAADNAYAYFYKELNQANNASGRRLKRRDPPNKSPFVEKIRMVRNIAIAHFPSDRARPIDAFAAMDWQTMSMPTGHLEELTFVPGRFRGTEASGQRVESQDLEVSGLKTPHNDHCLPYLNQYDEVCCEYLQALQAALHRP